MWQCRKCGKPVFFAERKQSLGFDWHPTCLRCEECGKRLNPGQHAEHKGVPFCHHPCYGALFGPQLFGHGTRNECHTSFGKVENKDGFVKRAHLEPCLKTYNQFYEGKPAELKSREVNGRLVLEGVLKIYWGVKKVIHLKEEDDTRMIACRRSTLSEIKNFSMASEMDQEKQNCEPPSMETIKDKKTDGTSDQLQPETNDETDLLNNTLTSEYSPSKNNNVKSQDKFDALKLTANTAIVRRRPVRCGDKSKLKRRCSINGHFYLRETSSFTPPYGSSCSIWVTSKTTSEEVLNIFLEKYKVEMSASNFALFVVKDTGEQRRIKENESPLITRVMLGPHENISRIFIMDAQKTKDISPEVAQFLNLSLVECRAILTKYDQEETKQIQNIRHKYDLMRFYIQKLKEHRGV